MKKGEFGAVISSFLWICLVCQRCELCDSINDEGRALLAFKGRVEVDPYGALANWDEEEDHPCSWFGVQCSADGRVLVLYLKDLSLVGTLSPDICKLKHLTALILHNNSLYGVVPISVGQLQKLEVLDLGHNKFSGLLPPNLRDILSLKRLILGSNNFSGNLSPAMHKFRILSSQDAVEAPSLNREFLRTLRDVTPRKWRSVAANSKEHAPHKSPPEDPAKPPQPPYFPPASRLSSPPLPASSQPHSTSPVVICLSIVGSVCFLIALSLIYWYSNRSKKVTSMPLMMGLTGLLTKEPIPPVRELLALGRLDLEAACEGFNNIVGSFSDFTLYKGTLSSGAEVAVMSTVITSTKDWSAQDEAEFRKKVSVLSKFNHNNFMNLLGYCKEKEPFTRMLAFEYASNGTLFEHLHIKEVEQLNWSARLRIAAGVAYCLEQMIKLNPPLLTNLNSSSIYLTEDYAAKVSDLEFWNMPPEADSTSKYSSKCSIVYKFGIVLLEIISGRLPYSEDDGLLVLWASSYLRGSRPIKDMIDETLESVPEEDIIGLTEVIKSCINDDPEKQATMTEVASRMRLITGITPEVASPKLSPLWWAESQIISSEV
ncbi:protein MALE DISCOVERER 2-like isoform X1 [Zingiber officinale]|uniref:protein MALE DISCOVERER 2-like isoform X1 n=1 Tax=Zingiber officinale TaxID=94328 RepID=UPI001C4CC9BE|nr:protein MALE DISCOVERER 2-like isoform X1 [Zingiber officinale]